VKSFDCDLQLHGPYAGGVSKYLSIPLLAEQSRLKGLEILVTGDIQHQKWFEHVNAHLIENQNGVYMDKDEKTFFIIGTEVEDHHRIHHLIYLPDLTAAAEFREKVKPFGILDCSMCGRPKLRQSPEQLSQIVSDVGGFMGPGHSFTPYTGLFSRYDSVAEAYGDQAKKIPFLELGLSADTDMADTILSNHQYAFLSSSDAHSAWPHRLGREWNRIRLKEPSFKELETAVWDRSGERIEFNAGLNPREGKYHATACNLCYTQYPLRDAIESFKMKCPACGGDIKRGVADRIKMLSDTPTGKHPSFRPPYKHQLPLAEIIQLALFAKSPMTKNVQSKWRDYIDVYKDEINVLIDAPESELIETNPEIGNKIKAFRNGLVYYTPGGGGKYGEPHLFDSQKEMDQFVLEAGKRSREKNKFSGQKSLKGF